MSSVVRLLIPFSDDNILNQGKPPIGQIPSYQVECYFRFHNRFFCRKYCIVGTMGAIQQNKAAGPVSEELALVQAAKRGDDSAFEELVRRYDRNVFRIAQHITQNREDAEDVVQEAFLKAYGNLAKFQEQSKFYTWLVRIAVNEALMKLRRRKPERTVSLDEDIKTEDDSLPREIADWSPNPEQQYTQAELREILSKTIQGLPPGFRTVFVLRDVEGLSTEETAAALELSVPAVKSRLLRARLQLRERLGKYFERRASVNGKSSDTNSDDSNPVDVPSGDGNQ